MSYYGYIELQYPVNFAIITDIMTKKSTTIANKLLKNKVFDKDLIDYDSNTNQIKLIKHSDIPKLAIYKGGYDVYLYKEKCYMKINKPPSALLECILVKIIDNINVEYISSYSETLLTIPSNIIFEHIFSQIDFTEKPNPNIIEPINLSSPEVFPLRVFSIDPMINFAQDIDDAISFEINDTTIEIGIHIADVSLYVNRYNIDISRTETIYFTDKVYHMLPLEIMKKCSLEHNQHRNAISVFVTLDKNGKLVKWNYSESIVINTAMNYNEADLLIQNDTQWNTFFNIVNLYRNKRLEKFPENIIKLNERFTKSNYYISDSDLTIVSNESNSHILVEELMLLANQLVGEEIMRKKSINNPVIFRHHPMNNHLMNDNFNDHPMNKIETQNTVIKAALYSTSDTHYALNTTNYTHFTSPIRRFNDIIVHQILLGRDICKIELDKMNQMNKLIEIACREEYIFKIYRYLYKNLYTGKKFITKIFNYQEISKPGVSMSNLKQVYLPELNIRVMIPNNIRSGKVQITSVNLLEMKLYFIEI